MTPEQKNALVRLLEDYEEMVFERSCFVTMFQAIEDGDTEKCVEQAINWRHNLQTMMNSSLREEHRATYRPLIDAAVASIQSPDIADILAKLLQGRGTIH